MMFLTHVVEPICILGVFLILLFSVLSDRNDAKVKVRQKALSEATDALRSIAHTAEKAAKDPDNDDVRAYDAEKRAYYYGRAADIVASIPVDRL